MAQKSKKNAFKMGLLAPRWAVLSDLGVMLRHVGGKMVTKIARMSQHRRQGANPRGFEGSAGARDGREHLSLGPSGAPREGTSVSRSLRRSSGGNVCLSGPPALLA